ncbi:MAG: transcriptional regulator [Ruminiclostridium sp.]
MQKKWVKWVAVILAVTFILTTLGAAGYSIFAGQ